jgi:hypothetical protein
MRRDREEGEVIFEREGEDDLPALVIRIPYTIRDVDYNDTTYVEVDFDNTHLHLLDNREMEHLRDHVRDIHPWTEPPDYD